MESILYLKRKVKRMKSVIDVLEVMINNGAVSQGAGSPEGVFDGSMWFDTTAEILYVNKTPGISSGGWIAL